MKIHVYAICKDEARFAERWAASMEEADGIHVLDTGSRDGTPALLRGLGVHVEEEEVRPWRFDTARNRSLDLVPEDADLCVCTDLDELFHPGWREAMERAWRPGVGQLRYRYTWSFNSDGSEGVVFWTEKAHARQGYRWVHPVHEVLRREAPGQGTILSAPGVQLDHHPDPGKSRGQYLPLLEQAVLEAPEDDRNMHYLGREYLYRGEWGKCILTLKRHLLLPTALWPDERCASMRYIAAAEQRLGHTREAERWLLRAAAEAPHLREPMVELARFFYDRGDYAGGLHFARKALAITHRPDTYITEPWAWGANVWDLAALCAWQMGLFQEAERWGAEAAEREPGNRRLQDNLGFYRQKLAKKDSPIS